LLSSTCTWTILNPFFANDFRLIALIAQTTM